ncbi:putative aminoadipate-semialdehyde dehydrogenase [Hypoxylon argillaceum]|nr:putative aminoadipate-semialdehyde dehydrogenase [Hypoxylon argillaceum]
MAPRPVMSLTEVDRPTLLDISKACNIPSALIEDVYTCTPTQLNMITETRAEIFHFIMSFGPTADIDRFCHAIRQVVSINSMLRTRIVECRLGLVQVTTNEEHVTEHLSSDLEQYLEDNRTRRFELGMPLFRTAFIDRVLVVTIHHAVIDYTSGFALLAQDLPAAYYKLTPSPRPTFKQFVTYCMNIDEAAARSFWASRFKGIPAIFPIPKPGCIPTPKDRAGRKIYLTRIGNGIPIAHIPYYIEAAWALTAATYSGSDSVAYGYVLSGRSSTLDGVESMLGPTIAEVPVQVNLQRNRTVEWLLKDRATALRQLQMHPASQYNIASIGAVNESAKIASCFQTLLNIVPVLPTGVKEADMDIKYDSTVHRRGAFAPFALQLVFRIQDDGILVEPRPDPTLVCDSQLSRILTQFEHVLKLLEGASPQTKLDNLQLLNDNDRSEILKWNTAMLQPKGSSLHELFQTQARAQPEALAIEARDGKLSYHRLDRMSECLAHRLRRRGVLRGQSVAFIFEKSLWAVVAILGIMKAGGVCVPIDKDDPYDRKAAIISITKANLVVTSPIGHTDLIGLAPDILAISPDRAAEWPKLELPGDSGLTSSSSPEDLAYIIFTGRSMGTLQGVLLEHGSLAYSLAQNSQRLGWEPDSRILQFAPYGSNISIAEIFGALLFGGCLCIPDEEACQPLKQKQKNKLTDYIVSAKVNSAMLPPSVIRTMSPSQVPGIKCLASIGEPIDVEAPKRWGGSLRFFNCWGACGASIINTVVELGPLSPYPEDNIGRPVGCAVWIVDPRDPNKLCAIGAVGELVVEGPGVARGYVQKGKATTTTASFISGPPPWAANFKDGKGGRLYRTGDLGSYNPDGSIAFVGKRTNQVKKAGHRIQLEEIEKVLMSCSEIEDATVLTKISAGRTELVAVVCLAGGVDQSTTSVSSAAAEPRLHAIRDYANARLMSHSVPTTWLAVEEVPRSTSGKRDRPLASKLLKRGVNDPQ